MCLILLVVSCFVSFRRCRSVPGFLGAAVSPRSRTSEGSSAAGRRPCGHGVLASGRAVVRQSREVGAASEHSREEDKTEYEGRVDEYRGPQPE